MDAREAREHLEMVDRILASADSKPVRLVPGVVVAWGIAAAIIDAGQQLYFSHVAGNAGIWAANAALILGILYSMAVAIALMRNKGYERLSIVERRMGTTIGAVWFTVLVASFAQPHVFAGWGGAAVWSMGAAIMMLMVGFDGDRRGVIGGLTLLVSVLAANYLFPHDVGYVLAAGFILGYAVPGALFLIDCPRGHV